jgi:hypothetical protein
MSPKSDNITDFLKNKDQEQRNPLLDEIDKAQGIISQMTEVDVHRTKVIFGMLVDAMQYLAMAAEGDPKTESTKSAKSLLAHYFNTINRAEATLNKVAVERPPTVILPLGVKKPGA